MTLILIEMIKKMHIKKLTFLLVAISLLTTLSFIIKNNSESYVHVATIDENKGAEIGSGVGKISLIIIPSNQSQSLNESLNNSNRSLR
jgi:hypothetical protein